MENKDYKKACEDSLRYIENGDVDIALQILAKIVRGRQETPAERNLKEFGAKEGLYNPGTRELYFRRTTDAKFIF